METFSPEVSKTAAVVVGAILALIGVGITNYFSTRNSSRNLFVETVTKERATWRSELRGHVATFCKQAQENCCSSGSVIEPAMYESRAHILLRLNPDPTHEHDAGLIQGVENAMKAVKAQDAKSLDAALADVEKCAQALLKQEWEKSKREAETGRVEQVRWPR